MSLETQEDNEQSPFEEVEAHIAALEDAVENGENIMPYLVDAAKAYATEGEMMGVLREKYGTYEDPGVF